MIAEQKEILHAAVKDTKYPHMRVEAAVFASIEQWRKTTKIMTVGHFYVEPRGKITDYWSFL